MSETDYIKINDDRPKTVVHVSVYDPSRPSIFKSKANEKAECRVISCSNSESCGLFKRGECAMIAVIDSQRCPYGSKQYQAGPTRRARTFHTWVSDKNKMYESQLNKLSSYKKKLAIVGGYVFLPYPHMNMNKKLPVEQHGFFMSSGTYFVHLSQFTVELIMDIVNFRPYAMMGGEITSYQEDVVPKFLMHLKEVMPNYYQKLVSVHPEVSVRTDNYSNVGRKARLASLKPGVVVTKYHNSKDLSTQHWTWDGTFLTSTDAGVSFSIVPYDECLIKMKPKPDAVVEIISDDQVDEDTEYVD